VLQISVHQLFYKKMSNYFTIKRKCFVCKRLYTNKDTIGAHSCREHWGKISGGKFTCCGIRTTSNSFKQFYASDNTLTRSQLGCIEADHNELQNTSPDDPDDGDYFPYSHDLDNAFDVLMRVVAFKLNIKPLSIVENIPRNSTVKINRCNVAQVEKEMRKKGYE
jgi:hypothetical protein